MERINLSWEDVDDRAEEVGCKLVDFEKPGNEDFFIYGVPRGGIFAAQAVLLKLHPDFKMTSDPNKADAFVDDIIDVGKTYERYLEKHGERLAGKTFPFFALVDKQGKDGNLGWVSFPWERMINEDHPADNIRRLFQYIGEDPERDGLKETPERVIKSYEKLFGGYKQKPSDVIKTFKDSCNEMVIIKNVEFYSTCEHHMLPFCGKAHIAYIPDGKIIGISKLVRILEIYSRRLQIQERLCIQITGALQELIKPSGAACILEAQHLCMICRGVEKQNSIMVTSSLIGSFKSSVSTRAEFMNMIRS